MMREAFGQGARILEPCAGAGAVTSVLRAVGFDVVENDLYRGGSDYLRASSLHDSEFVVTNPPFSLWDEFVRMAKTHCRRFWFIGRLNYLGTVERQRSGLWKNLRAVHVFNRYVDYRTPYRDDGRFHVGAMATAWFEFDMTFESATTLDVVDVQQYATLGAFKEKV